VVATASASHWERRFRCPWFGLRASIKPATDAAKPGSRRRDGENDELDRQISHIKRFLHRQSIEQETGF
jgi:hypothetical protein